MVLNELGNFIKSTSKAFGNQAENAKISCLFLH